MSFVKERKFGVIKIEGFFIKLYTSQTSYSVINIGSEIRDARWNGNELFIYLTCGKVRKYNTQSCYSTF